MRDARATNRNSTSSGLCCLPRGSASLCWGRCSQAFGAGSRPRTRRSNHLASRSPRSSSGRAHSWCGVSCGGSAIEKLIGTDPLVHLDLLKILPLRSGLMGLVSQNLILMGVFFSIPLYLQLVLGFDALETGLKMLPVSIAMFIAAAVGSKLSAKYSIRTIVRVGLSTTLSVLSVCS